MLAQGIAVFFGLVNNLKSKHWTVEEKFKMDGEMLGIFGLTWNIIKCRAPREVMEPVLKAIRDSGMPEMAAKGYEGE